jgi:phosphoribosylamine--glycine ligase
MKLHFRSVDGSILSVAYHCQQEGTADISCSIAETEDNAREQYKGLLKFYHDNWQSRIDRDTVVIFDQISRGEEADRLKDAGIPVIGAGKFNDRLELDRAFAMEWTQQHGIAIPESWTFTDYNEAVDFIKEYPGRLVFKPSGTLPAETTYVSQDEGNVDLLYHLERLEHLSKGAEFILQQVIDGIEISTEGWYYKGQLIPPPNATMEEKKLMTGGLGAGVGCAGNVVWLWDHPGSYMYDHTLKKLEPELVKEDYTGTLDINTIYVPEENKLYALEYCPRFGYAGIENLCAMVQAFGSSMSEVFWLWGMGKLESIPVVPAISVAIVITVPRSKDGTVPKHEYIGGNIDYSRFFWGDVQLDKKSGNLISAGVDGIIATLVETAPTIDEALAKAYTNLDKLILSNKQYRIDIGCRYKQQFPTIERVDRKYRQSIQRAASPEMGHNG